jgi:hypothetical protein
LSENELKISDNLSLPREAATWVLAYLAKRGAGKTYNAAVQAEEMVKAGIPIGVVDGMGIWWGLRASADGKGEGLPIVVFGGEHADLPLVPEKAAEVAKAIVESNISFVLDLSSFSKYISRKIVIAFLDELYRLNRVDRHIFIEESDMFAPQKPIGPEENLCLSSVDNFVRRGGNHNLGCTLITQRSAVLNKNILTQSDCLVILRTLAPVDKKAIQAWVEQQTDEDEEKLKQWYDSLNNLENGEAWVWHPEKTVIYKKVKFRRRETFHATREFIRSPQATQVKLMNVSEFVSKFKSIFEQGQVSPVDASVHTSVDKAEFEKLQQALKDEQQLHASTKDDLKRLEKSIQEKLMEADLTGYSRGRADAEGEMQLVVNDWIKRAKDLEKENTRLSEGAEGFNKLKAALGLDVLLRGVVEDVLKESLPSLLPKVLPSSLPVSDGAVAVVVTETIPEIEHKIERPIVQTSEASRDGQLITLAYHGFFDEKRRLGEIGKEMNRLYLFNTKHLGRDLPQFLEQLIQLKVLQREEAKSGDGWVYSIADGAKDRIKEVA